MSPSTTIHRILLTLALATAAGAAWPAVNAAADPTVGAPCTREQMAWLPGSQRVEVLDSDPTGRFQVGVFTDSQFTSHLIRWVDGTPEDLGTTHLSARGINSSGDIAGTRTVDETTFRSVGWRYRDGQFTDLPAEQPDRSAITTAINADGTVSGFTQLPGAGSNARPVTWSADDVLHPLPLPPGDDMAIADDIDDDGTIVGNAAAGADSLNHPVRWRVDGTVAALPQFRPGPNTGTSALVTRGGWTVGAELYEFPDETPEQVLRWADGAAAPEVLGQGEAEAVNARGWTVMITSPTAKLWLFQDGVLRSLPTDTTPFPTGRVNALTDAGFAYGFWNSTPVRWDCRLAP